MPSIRLQAALAAVLVVGLVAGPARGDEFAPNSLRFRLMLHDGSHIEGRNGVLTADRITGTDRDGQPVAVDLADVHSLDVASGTKSGSTALIGAGAGLATSLLAVVQVSADPETELNDSAVVPVVAATTAVGALVGMLIGSGMPRWERVPVQPRVGLSAGGAGPACGLCLRF